jgi:hypothetical protein
MTLREFHRRYPSSEPLDTVALVNDLAPDTNLSRGDVVKRIVGGPGASQR